MESRTWILLVFVGIVLLGCTSVTRPEAEEETNATNITNETTTNETIQIPQAILPAETNETPVEETIAEEPEVSETTILKTKTYTDSKGRLRFQYPENWRIKSELGGISDSLTVEITDLENYPDDKIQVSYSVSQISFEQEKAELEAQEAELESVWVNGQEFVVYETEFEPLPGKRIKERRAFTIFEGHEYRIALIAKSKNFEALLSAYELVLNSVEIE